ncbi:hypothetical protein ACVWYQ_006298 [Bradyrhizobium sp. USDA 3397]
MRLQRRKDSQVPEPFPTCRLEGASCCGDCRLYDLRAARRLSRKRDAGFRTIGDNARYQTMSDAFDYFRAYAVRALCKARSMPQGKMKHLQLVAGRIYNLLKKEAAYAPNMQHLEDFRAAQKLERSLNREPDVAVTAQRRVIPEEAQDMEREAH